MDKSDIAVITETHFKAKHSDGAVEIAGYNVFRRDRERRKGGGVAVYVNSAQQAIVWRPSADDNTFELLWIRTSKLFIGALYHPPKPLYQPEALLNQLELVRTDRTRISCSYCRTLWGFQSVER